MAPVNSPFCPGILVIPPEQKPNSSPVLFPTWLNTVWELKITVKKNTGNFFNTLLLKGWLNFKLWFLPFSFFFVTNFNKQKPK